jgi:hypothetical protein
MGAAIATNLIKDFVVPGGYKKFVPIPSAVSIPFFIGAPIAIDFCMGGAIMLIWCVTRRFPSVGWTCLLAPVTTDARLFLSERRLQVHSATQPSAQATSMGPTAEHANAHRSAGRPCRCLPCKPWT